MQFTFAIRRCLLLFIVVGLLLPFLQSMVSFQTFSGPSSARIVVNSPDSQAPQASRKRNTNNTALIILDTDLVQRMKEAIRFIKEEGGEVVHVYPTHVLIGYVSRELRARSIGQMSIQEITYDVADPKKYSKFGKVAEAAVEAWNNNFKGRSRIAGLEPPPGFRDPHP